MTLRDVREWIDTLPKNFLEFKVVKNIEQEKFGFNGQNFYRLDKPLVSLNVNEYTKEILVMNSEPQKK